VSLRPLGYVDYVKKAFWRSVPVRGLGTLPLNPMVLAGFGLLGLFNPGFWLLGGALEVGYLALRSGSARFQKLIEGERLLAAQEGWEDRVHAAIERLSDKRQERYRRLLAQCRTILGAGAPLEEDTLGGLRDMKERNLNQLLTIFLRLLNSQEVIRDNLSAVDTMGLEGEIAEVEKRLGEVDPEADGALARSLHGTLDIQRKRLENLQKAQASLRVIDAELLRIEQQVELLREETAIAGDPETLSNRLDSVTTQMTETSRWMDANQQLLGSLGGLTDDQAAAEVASLPRMDEGLGETE
jgi:hypothetical protein